MLTIILTKSGVTMRTFFVLLVMSLNLILQNANAISIRGKDKVFSSGPDIYFCNAGVASAFLKNKVCYFRGTKNYCTPDSCSSAAKNCNTNCVCIDKGGAGESFINKIQLDYKAYNSSEALKPAKKIAMGPKFQTVFSEQESWDKEIENVRTYFMTEAYTASYFKDVCYRGSQIPGGEGAFHITANASAIPFEVLDPSGFNSFDNNRSGLNFDLAHLGKVYAEKAELAVSVYVACGSKKETTGFKFDADGVPNGVLEGQLMKVDKTQIRAANLEKFMGYVLDPKFCKVRYVFNETNWSSATPNPRDNKAEGAEICTHTTISDPL